MRSHIVMFALAIPAIASAHVSLTSGPAADTGGNKLDTVEVTVTIPGVTGARGPRSDFGNPTDSRSGTSVTAITWTKPARDLLDGDDSYDEVKLPAKVPDLPFSKLQWNVTQACEDSDITVQLGPELHGNLIGSGWQ